MSTLIWSKMVQLLNSYFYFSVFFKSSNFCLNLDFQLQRNSIFLTSQSFICFLLFIFSMDYSACAFFSQQNLFMVCSLRISLFAPSIIYSWIFIRFFNCCTLNLNICYLFSISTFFDSILWKQSQSIRCSFYKFKSYSISFYLKNLMLFISYQSVFLIIKRVCLAFYAFFLSYVCGYFLGELIVMIIGSMRSLIIGLYAQILLQNVFLIIGILLSLMGSD